MPLELSFGGSVGNYSSTIIVMHYFFNGILPMGFIVKKKREMRHKVFDCNKISEDGKNQ